MAPYLRKICLFLLLLFLYFFFDKKREKNIENPIYKREQKQKKGSFFLCLFFPFLYFICAKFLHTNIENTLDLFLLLLPLSLWFSSKEKSPYCTIDTIYYKENIKEEERKLFAKAKIKLIKTNEDKKVIYEKDLYQKIKKSKKEYDNYVKAKRYTMSTYIPLVLSYFLFLFLSFPFTLDIETILFIKIITILADNYIYKRIPEEQDIMRKGPYKQTERKQEILLFLMQLSLILFAITLPYMYFLANLEQIKRAQTIYLLVTLFSNLWITLYEYRESATLLNLLKIRKQKEMVLYVFLIFSLTILYTLIKNPSIGVQNYVACFLTSLLFLSPLEVIKLARFTKIKE